MIRFPDGTLVSTRCFCQGGGAWGSHQRSGGTGLNYNAGYSMKEHGKFDSAPITKTPKRGIHLTRLCFGLAIGVALLGATARTHSDERLHQFV